MRIVSIGMGSLARKKRKKRSTSACATELRLLLVSFRKDRSQPVPTWVEPFHTFYRLTLYVFRGCRVVSCRVVSCRVSDHPVVIIRGYLLVTAIRYTAMRPFLFIRIVYFRNGACNFSIELNILTITMRKSRSYS